MKVSCESTNMGMDIAHIFIDHSVSFAGPVHFVARSVNIFHEIIPDLQ